MSNKRCDLRITPEDERIWERFNPPITKNEFYAILNCKSIMQPRQERVAQPLSYGPVYDTFLDRLALLFARAKGHFPPPADNPAHVTSTGLITTKATSRDAKSEWEVYISKNNGPHEADENCEIQTSDEEFAEHLEGWLNQSPFQPSRPTDPVADTKLQELMLHHWRTRINFYHREVQRIWDTIEAKRQEIHTYFSEHHKNDVKLCKFDQDWVDATELVQLVSHTWSKESNEVVVDMSTYQEFYLFWTRPDKNAYPKSKSQKKGGDEPWEAFRKCLKYLEMLGMPTSFWKSFNEFREQGNGKVHYKLTFMAKPCLVESTVDAKGVQAVWKEWQSAEDVTDTMKKAMSGVIKSWKRKRPQVLHFHCELQLLSLFLQLESSNPNCKPHAFIGGSKLSCAMCYLTLKCHNQKYRTRGSHHQIYSDCAYAFATSLEGVTRNLEQTISTFRSEIIGNVREVHTAYDHTDQGGSYENKDYLTRRCLKMIQECKVQSYPYNGIERPYLTMPGNHRSGGFATVHQAIKHPNMYESGPPEIVALKEIRIRSSNQTDDVKKEISVLRQVSDDKHPNILRLVEAYFEQTTPCTIYLATSPWAPISLQSFVDDLIENKSQPPMWYKVGKCESWVSIITQCLGALHFLHNHEKGPIKHKDLKPHHILLYEDESNPERHGVRPVIADFGLSKLSVRGGSTDHRGTPEFKAPEQVNLRLDSTLETDIWQLGCCFAFILALLHSGNEGLKLLLQDLNMTKLFHYAKQDDQRECGFYYNIGRVLQRLDEFGDDPPTGARLVLPDLRVVVKGMLELTPEKRSLTAAGLKSLDVEARQAVKNLAISCMYIFYYDEKRYTGKLVVDVDSDFPTLYDLQKHCSELALLHSGDRTLHSLTNEAGEATSLHFSELTSGDLTNENSMAGVWKKVEDLKRIPLDWNAGAETIPPSWLCYKTWPLPSWVDSYRFYKRILNRTSTVQDAADASTQSRTVVIIFGENPWTKPA